MIIHCICGFCGVTTVPLEFHDSTFNGVIPEEAAGFKFRAMEKQAPTWGVRFKDSQKCPICPRCLDLQSQPEADIPEFVHSDECPKCATGRLGATYCNGQAMCQDTREHLHRRCGGCGFEMTTKVRGPRPMTKEERWAQNVKPMWGQAMLYEPTNGKS